VLDAYCGRGGAAGVWATETLTISELTGPITGTVGAGGAGGPASEGTTSTGGNGANGAAYFYFH
jgi:hypothetical protein